MTEFPRQFDHEWYEELCALATAGALMPAESELLATHLKICTECNEAFGQYKNIATHGMPLLADCFSVPSSEDFSDGNLTNRNAFDEQAALARLMGAAGKKEPQGGSLPMTASGKSSLARSVIRGLVAASLVAGASVGAYSLGAHSANQRLRGENLKWKSAKSSLERVTAEKQTLKMAMRAEQRQIAALEQQAAVDKHSTKQLRADVETGTEHLASLTAAMIAAKQKSETQLAVLSQQQEKNASRLRDALNRYQTAEEELHTLRSQHRKDLNHLASMETRVDWLTVANSYATNRARIDERYLAADKDIRDLMAARHLYIADIMDVNEHGQSRKPFGRVFYTRNKSLLFYAYDLDHQFGVKQTSTFQVWGRAGANGKHIINLGILYMDSRTKRRWTLRVDNPKQLTQLNSIFVTIERHQTKRPTGKPFLYASLQREPNLP